MTRRARRDAALDAVAIAASSAAGIVLYLWTPVERGLMVPFGADTPAHLWRARMAASQGLSALVHSSALNFQVNPDRLGLPVLASVLTGIGVGPWRLMFIVPALSAAVLGPAAWALGRAIPEARWAAPIYAFAVVGSIPFAITTRSNLDNALADGLILGAAAAVLLAADGRAAIAAGALLLGGALLMHWPAGSLFTVVLALFAVALAPSAIAGARRGTPLRSSPAVRVGAIVAGGLALGGLPLLATPGGNLPDAGTGRFFRGNVDRLLPLFRLPWTLGLALVGAVRLAVARPPGEPRRALILPRRRAVILMVAWMVPVGLAAADYARGGLVPLMRFLQVAFPIPVLGAAALAGLVALAAAAPRARTAHLVGAAIVVAGVLAVSLTMAFDAAADARPAVTDQQLGPIRAATAFLARSDAPELVLVADGDPGIPFRRVRMLAAGPTIDRIGVFPGTADELFAAAAAGPAPPVDPALTGAVMKRAQIAADAVGRMRTPGAVALALRPFVHGFDKLAQDSRNVAIADGVLVLRPAEQPAVATPAPIGAPPASALILATLLSVVVLTAAGSGWSVALVPVPWNLRAALAPAIGLAAVLVAGTVIGLTGARTDHAAGLLVLIGVAASGWAVAAALGRLRRTEAPTV